MFTLHELYWRIVTNSIDQWRSETRRSNVKNENEMEISRYSIQYNSVMYVSVLIAIGMLTNQTNIFVYKQFTGNFSHSVRSKTFCPMMMNDMLAIISQCFTLIGRVHLFAGRATRKKLPVETEGTRVI